MKDMGRKRKRKKERERNENIKIESERERQLAVIPLLQAIIIQGQGSVHMKEYYLLIFTTALKTKI